MVSNPCRAIILFLAVLGPLFGLIRLPYISDNPETRLHHISPPYKTYCALSNINLKKSLD